MIPLHDDNPTRIKPWLTVMLIIACVLVFVWQISLGSQVQQAMYSFGLVPSALLGDQQLPSQLVSVPVWMTLFTSMFFHGGWMHLIGNMLYLWVFGNNIEDAMGHKRFIVFYLLCGVIAALAHAIPQSGSSLPMVGASGAISGILGAYLLLYPRAKILVAVPIIILFFTIRLPAFWVLAFWFVFQLFNSILTANPDGGVAWGAHIGGFVAGVLLIPFFKYKHIRLFAPARRSQ